MIWRGGKSPPGAVPGTFEQEVALPQVHWQKSRAGSVMLQQEKKECEPMKSETGVSAPVARNWAENRETKPQTQKNKPNQTAPDPCSLLAAALRCVEHLWGRRCVCPRGGSLLCSGVFLNSRGLRAACSYQMGAF